MNHNVDKQVVIKLSPVVNQILTIVRETDTRKPLMQYKLHVKRGTSLMYEDM